jgi:tripartite-type tricarboxylate transporter receptor subunit TctC
LNPSPFVRCLAAAALALTWGLAGAQPSQSYPVKPIRFLVPFAPGGIGDLTARIVAQKMAENMGQAVVVDNRPGAGMILTATAALQSAADGYTMVLAGNGTAVSATLFKSLPYDILRDFVQVSTLATFDLVIVTSPGSKLGGVADLIAAAKRNPGKLNFGTISLGSTQSLSAELFKSVAGVSAQVVPFKGTPALVTALRGGDVDVAFEFAPPAIPHVKAGAIRALAVAAARRHPDLPDVPTTVEAGLADFQVSSWNAVSVRTGTPPALVQRLNREIVTALQSAEVKQKLNAIGAEPLPGTPQETRERMAREIKRWGEVIIRANIPRQ